MDFEAMIDPFETEDEALYGEGFDNEWFGEDEDLFGDSELELEFGLGEARDPGTAMALMEMLAGQAAEAESEQEADMFLPAIAALAPLAAQLAPAAMRIGGQLLPKLAGGVVSLGKRLLRSSTGRQVIRTLPTIARRAAHDVLKTHAGGRPVTTSTVTRSLARQTAKVLRDPRQRKRCIQHSRRVTSNVQRRVRAAQAR